MALKIGSYNTLTTRQELTDYCLRKLGHPVVEINISDEQIDDRIDDAMQMYFEFVGEGSHRLIFPLQITQHMLTTSQVDFDDIKNDDPAGERAANSIWNASQLTDRIISIVGVYPFTNTSSVQNFMDLNYQIRLNDMGDLAGGLGELAYYEQLQQYLSLSDMKLTGHPQIRWLRRDKKLFIDGDLKPTNSPLKVGDYVMVEFYVHTRTDGNADTFFNSIFLKEFGASLLKRQWGENLSKFEGVTLPGGVTINGQRLIDEANTEIEQIRERINNEYDDPPSFFIG